jgi:hypothetical protein
MESRSIGERQTSTRWPSMLAEGKSVMDGESMVPFKSIVFTMLCYMLM